MWKAQCGKRFAFTHIVLTHTRVHDLLGGSRSTWAFMACRWSLTWLFQVQGRVRITGAVLNCRLLPNFCGFLCCLGGLTIRLQFPPVRKMTFLYFHTAEGGFEKWTSLLCFVSFSTLSQPPPFVI